MQKSQSRNNCLSRASLPTSLIEFPRFALVTLVHFLFNSAKKTVQVSVSYIVAVFGIAMIIPVTLQVSGTYLDCAEDTATGTPFTICNKYFFLACTVVLFH